MGVRVRVSEFAFSSRFSEFSPKYGCPSSREFSSSSSQLSSRVEFSSFWVSEFSPVRVLVRVLEFGCPSSRRVEFSSFWVSEFSRLGVRVLRGGVLEFLGVRVLRKFSSLGVRVLLSRVWVSEFSLELSSRVSGCPSSPPRFLGVRVLVRVLVEFSVVEFSS